MKDLRKLGKHKGKLSLQETPIKDQTYIDEKTQTSLQGDWLKKRRVQRKRRSTRCSEV